MTSFRECYLYMRNMNAAHRKLINGLPAELQRPFVAQSGSISVLRLSAELTARSEHPNQRKVVKKPPCGSLDM